MFEQVELILVIVFLSKMINILFIFFFRHLKPYIFRDPVTKPLWLQMLNELKEHFRRKNKLPELIENETIDYSYVRAKHIRSVNALARQFFWPGIDCKSFVFLMTTLQ